MNLADSQAVRNELGKNDTVALLTLRKALALANPPATNKEKNESDQYDSAEDNLITRLEALAQSPLAANVETAVANTIQRLSEAVVRLKPPVAAQWWGTGLFAGLRFLSSNFNPGEKNKSPTSALG